jgi:hypothetical protein
MESVSLSWAIFHMASLQAEYKAPIIRTPGPCSRKGHARLLKTRVLFKSVREQQIWPY